MVLVGVAVGVRVGFGVPVLIQVRKAIST